MTPGARVAAAITLLDTILDGAPAERALTNWARGARYAGSGDRAAVRDHVFGALRCLRSCAALGGGQGGRALMLGALRAQGIDPECIFSGHGHDPAPLSAAERQGGRVPDAAEARDLPDWLWPLFQRALDEDAEAAAAALRHRAPITLRVNARRADRATVQEGLAREGIVTRPIDGLDHALQVLDGERRISGCALYAEGAVELQDTGSQSAMAALDLPAGVRLLDYCAGGGGKVLALAATHEGAWFAHDADPRRMADLPARARRAGVQVRLCGTGDLAGLAPFDAVLCDVPCSGSGTWRRAPQAKWDLTPEALARLSEVQHEILRQAATLLAPDGRLIYTTCSVFREENEEVIARFLRDSPNWRQLSSRRWPISASGDGFFLAQLCRETQDAHQP